MSKRLLLLIIVLLGSQMIQAQRGMRLGPEQRAQQMQDSLLLSDAQTGKLLELFSASQQQMIQIKDSLMEIGAMENMRAAMMDIRKEESEKIQLYLTTDQWNSWQAIQERRRASKKQEKKPKN